MKGVLLEIAIFWTFMFAGRYADNLMKKLSDPETESAFWSLAIVNLQILLIITIASIIAKYTPQGRTKIPGSGILYAFSFLQTQESFKKRTSKVAKLI